MKKTNQTEIFIEKSLNIIKEIEPFLSQLSTISKEAILDFKNRIINFSKSIHKPIKNENNKLNRNTIVEVIYLHNNIRKKGKYKIFEDDIKKGVCFIDKVVTKN